MLVGLRIAVDYGFFPLVIKTDSSDLAKYIHNITQLLTSLGLLVDDIYSIFNHFSALDGPRDRNKLTYGLAKLSFMFLFDIEDVPTKLEPIVLEDI